MRNLQAGLSELDQKPSQWWQGMAWPRKEFGVVLVSKEVIIQDVEQTEVCEGCEGSGTWLCCYSWTVNFADVKQNIL